MSSSVHMDNKKKVILIPGKVTVQGLDQIVLITEAQYSINFSRSNRYVLIILHYKGSNSFLFVYPTEIYQFKAKDPEMKKYPLPLGKFPEDFSANNMKKQD